MERCSCGKKFGEHNYEFEIEMKEFCVVCGYRMPEQCEENYLTRGNYCSKCNNRCGVDVNDKGYNTKRKDALIGLLALGKLE